MKQRIRTATFHSAQPFLFIAFLPSLTCQDKEERKYYRINWHDSYNGPLYYCNRILIQKHGCSIHNITWNPAEDDGRNRNKYLSKEKRTKITFPLTYF